MATEAHYMEMWFQDGLAMDTYATTAQQAVVLPQQTPAPSTSDGGTSANAAAATQAATNTATNSGTNLVTALQNLAPSLTTNSGTTSTNGVSALAAPAAAQTASTAATAPLTTAVGSAAGTLLPIQATYYATMLASMPAKMLISLGNSMSASQALQAGQQAMLADVQSLVDGKLKALLGSISGQMRGFGSQITAQLASAGKLGGLSVPNGWAQNAPQMVRAAPILPANSIAAPSASAGMPTSPYTQALMGSLNGRGMATQAAKTQSVKVETRTPAGG
jgi:PPE-repeat protein